MKTKYFLQGLLSSLYFSLFYTLWLTVNTQQLHAWTRLPVHRPFWSFHLLPCHTFAPIAEAPSHWSKQGKKEKTWSPFDPCGQLRIVYLFLSVTKALFTWCSWHYLISSLGVLFCLRGDSEGRRALIWSQGCHNTPPEIHHTVWFPPEIHVLSHVPEKTRKAVTHLSFTAAIIEQSHFAAWDVLSASVQPPLSLSAVYYVWGSSLKGTTINNVKKTDCIVWIHLIYSEV